MEMVHLVSVYVMGLRTVYKLLGERCPTNAQGCCNQFFIVLNKLPQHVSASKCHLQGLHYPYISYSRFLVCVSGGYGLMFTRCGHLLQNASQYVQGVYTGTPLSIRWTSPDYKKCSVQWSR
jgi:hypothetical protein